MLYAPGSHPRTITDRQTCFHHPFLESYSASTKKFDNDQRRDRHHSAHGVYSDAAVRPVLGGESRIGAD